MSQHTIFEGTRVSAHHRLSGWPVSQNLNLTWNASYWSYLFRLRGPSLVIVVEFCTCQFYSPVFGTLHFTKALYLCCHCNSPERWVLFLLGGSWAVPRFTYQILGKFDLSSDFPLCSMGFSRNTCDLQTLLCVRIFWEACWNTGLGDPLQYYWIRSWGCSKGIYIFIKFHLEILMYPKLWEHVHSSIDLIF